MAKALKIFLISCLCCIYSINSFAIETNNKLDIKLYDAIRDRNPLLVKKLINKGANVNQSRNIYNAENISPLILATYSGNIEIIKAILKTKKVNINYKDGDGSSALLVACVTRQPEIAELLIKNGADINVKSPDLMPLLILISLNPKIGSKKIIELLIKNGADVNIRHKDGATALWLNALDNNKDMVNFLLKNGANPNIKNNSGSSPLTEVAVQGTIEMVDILIKNKANINSKDNHGATALMMASGVGNKEIVQLLIKKGANVNDKDNDDNTVLDYATESKNSEVYNLLIKSGAKKKKWLDLIMKYLS